MSTDFVHVVLLKIRADADATFLRSLFDDIIALSAIRGVLCIESGPAARAVYPDYEDFTAGERQQGLEGWIIGEEGVGGEREPPMQIPMQCACMCMCNCSCNVA